MVAAGDPNPLLRDDILNLVLTLDSPLFIQLINIQSALSQLQHISLDNTLDHTFDFDLKTGQLVFLRMDAANDKANDASNDGETASSTGAKHRPPSSISRDSAAEAECETELENLIERMSEGRQLKTIVLYKKDKTSLGFGVVGLRSESCGELGIFVQDIQPGGIAAK